MWHIWLIIAGVCFIIEMMTVGFLVFWFGIGALLTMIVSLIFPDNIIFRLSRSSLKQDINNFRRRYPDASRIHIPDNNCQKRNNQQQKYQRIPGTSFKVFSVKTPGSGFCFFYFSHNNPRIVFSTKFSS